MFFKNQLRAAALGLATLLIFVLASCEVATNDRAASKAALSTGTAWDGKQTLRTPQDMNKPIVMGYYPSWSLGWIPADGVTTLSTLPDHVTHVIFSFAKANLRYTKGSYDLSQTGIQSDASAGKRLALSIELLRRRGTKVILSLGGETYWRSPENYTDIKYQDIKDLVDDYGFDGIDWDYEPQGGFALLSNKKYRDYYIAFIRKSRNLMRKDENYLIMTAPPGVGVLGGSLTDQDDSTSPFKYENRSLYGDANAQGGTSTEASGLFSFATTGSMIPVLSAPGSGAGKKIGNDLDLVAYQSYNTGKAVLTDNLDNGRMVMYRSWLYYAKKYGFALAHGTHVPPEPWGNLYVHTPRDMARIAGYVASKNAAESRADGVMIWQLFMKSNRADKHNGISYLKIASDFLGGATLPGYDFGSADYGAAVDLGKGPVVVGKPPGGASDTPAVQKVASSHKPKDKKLRPYDAEAVYSESGYLVSYEGRIYENKWWTQGDTPGGTGTSPWKLQADAQANPAIASESPALRDEVRSESAKNAKEGEVEREPGVQGSGVQQGGSTSGAVQKGSENPESPTPWDSSVFYPKAGYYVSHEGRTYKSQWYVNAGAEPGASPWNGWTEVRSDGSSALRKGENNRSDWSKDKIYPGADYYVSHKGANYRSRWYANAGQEPGNEDVWEKVTP